MYVAQFAFLLSLQDIVYDDQINGLHKNTMKLKVVGHVSNHPNFERGGEYMEWNCDKA